MARKITMFELHFDGAHFGPSFGEEETPMADEETTDAEIPVNSSSVTRTLVSAVGSVAVASFVGWMAIRRFRGGRGEDDIEITDVEAMATPIDQ
ncbi:hypothetical protein [Haladaptatus sp. NG-WS-4]